MLWKSSPAFLALGAVVSHALVGVAAVPVVSRDEDIVAPPSLVLRPAPHRGLDPEDPPSLDLLKSDSFFWTHEAPGILANLTVLAKDEYRLLNGHRFAAAVRSVDCSASAITITFHDADGLSSARAAWSWVDDGPENKIVYVVDDGACGGQHGRQPYYVGSVAYDAASRSAVLAASAAHWRDFSADASIRLRGDAGAIAKRDADYKIPFDLSYDFGTRATSFNKTGLWITAECADCKITGGLDFDLEFSFLDGYKASLTTRDGFGFRFAVAFAVGGTLPTAMSKTWDIVTIPLAGIAIRDVLQLGPAINVQAELGVTGVSGRITTEMGMAMSIPDGQGISIGEHVDLAPQWSIIGPTVDAKISADLYAVPLTTLSLAGTFYGYGIVAGLLLSAPIMRAEIRAFPGPSGKACPPLGIPYTLNVGMELASFAGVGDAKQRPNKALLYSADADFYNGCVPIVAGIPPRRNATGQGSRSRERLDINDSIVGRNES